MISERMLLTIKCVFRVSLQRLKYVSDKEEMTEI